MSLRHRNKLAFTLIEVMISVFLVLLLILLLSVLKRPKLPVPIDLQRIGDQSVVRVHTQVATLCQFRLVARPFDLLSAQLVDVVQTSLQFLLDRERDVDGHRRHDVEQQVANHRIHLAPGNPLADRLWIVDGASVADIVGDPLPGTDVVDDLHALAADAAQHEAL